MVYSQWRDWYNPQSSSSTKSVQVFFPLNFRRCWSARQTGMQSSMMVYVQRLYFYLFYSDINRWCYDIRFFLHPIMLTRRETKVPLWVFFFLLFMPKVFLNYAFRFALMPVAIWNIPNSRLLLTLPWSLWLICKVTGLASLMRLKNCSVR